MTAPRVERVVEVRFRRDRQAGCWFSIRLSREVPDRPAPRMKNGRRSSPGLERSLILRSSRTSSCNGSNGGGFLELQDCWSDAVTNYKPPPQTINHRCGGREILEGQAPPALRKRRLSAA